MGSEVFKKVVFIKKLYRLSEVFLMTGFFMIGALWSFSKVEQNNIISLLFIFISSFNLILSIYSFNTFFGEDADIYNNRLVKFSKNKKNRLLFWAILQLLVSVLFSLLVDIQLVKFVIGIELIWLIYSNKWYGLKRYPFTGTVTHFVGQIFHFWMTYSAFSVFNINAFFISVYFSLIFASGHLHHESIDFEADKKAGLNTSVSIIGIKKGLLLSYIFFIVGFLYWITLVLFELVSFQSIYPILIGFIIQSVLFFRNFGKMIEDQSWRLFYRTSYRILHFLIGISLVFINIFY